MLSLLLLLLYPVWPDEAILESQIGWFLFWPFLTTISTYKLLWLLLVNFWKNWPYSYFNILSHLSRKELLAALGFEPGWPWLDNKFLDFILRILVFAASLPPSAKAFLFLDLQRLELFQRATKMLKISYFKVRGVEKYIQYLFMYPQWA